MTDWHFVIASGPSLTRADCDAVRGLGPTIAVNCAVFLCPWVDELYGGDSQFWRFYGPNLLWFKGRRICRSKAGPDIKVWHPEGRTGGNSGHQAVQRAVDAGAKNIALLGFDHQHTNGMAHYHGDHPRNNQVRLGNAGNTKHWQQAMNRTAAELERKGVQVVNLSRATALTCFHRMTLEEFLGQ